MQQYLLAVDIGGANTALGLYSTDFKLCRSAGFPTDTRCAPEEFFERMQGRVSAFLKEGSVEKQQVQCAGAVFAGHIRYDDGMVVNSANIPQLKGVNLRQGIAQALGMPVELDNDANGATLAENALGAGQGHANMVYLTVSTGIGGGIIADGRLLRGNYGMAGEIGHMKVASGGGYPCNCGKQGCVESIASGPNIERYVHEALSIRESSSLSKLKPEAVTIAEIAKAAHDGDALAKRAISRAAAALGHMLANMYEVLNMECVVYGGPVCRAGDTLINAMLETFRQNSPNAESCPVQFKPAERVEDACMLGAALLAAGYAT